MLKPGRNDPCPCGSGRKYKQCCANQQAADEHRRVMGPVMDELKELIKGKNFGSLDEVNAFMQRHMEQRNRKPLADFHGLSSEQMHRFLHFPFATPHLVTFPSRLESDPQAPILSLFKLLAEGIGDDGMKATTTGNLPRNFCREAARTYLSDEEYQDRWRFGELRSEPEFRELHTTRLAAELAGLIRKAQGKFTLSRECRKLLVDQGHPAIYLRLFRVFVREYNWAYGDYTEEVPFIQQSFLFSLYLLFRYGEEWRSSTFYEDCFLRAFPDLLAQVQPAGSHFSPEQEVRFIYSLRFLERFACFFGLAASEGARSGHDSEGFRVKKLPLLDQVVQFHL